jgi:hypothetical protein
MSGSRPGHRTDDKQKTAPQPSRQHVEETLDEALEDSFPASDPPSTTQPGGRRSLTDTDKAEGKR